MGRAAKATPTALPLPRLRGRIGVEALSALEFAERAPTRLALLGTLHRKREREEETLALVDLHRRGRHPAVDHDGLAVMKLEASEPR
jgi:hypothetical protein